MLTHQAYGKARVRLLRVLRSPERHEPRDLSIDVRLEGDFEPAYSGGDNRRVLPTDTIRNTVYVLARESRLDSPVAFALALARRFLDRLPHVSTVRVEIESRPWQRVELDGAPHPHAFVGVSREQSTCRVDLARDRSSIECGVKDLDLLRTTGSSFSGFLRDEHTTLADADDRVLRTSVEATWSFADGDADPVASERAARRALVETFASEPTRSVQELALRMGRAVLARCPELTRVRLRLPNLHHPRVDLALFGLTNDGEVLAPAAEPYGVIEATVEAAPRGDPGSAEPPR